MGEILKWGIPAAGVLVGIYGLICTLFAKPSGKKPKIARGFYVWPNSLSTVVAVVTTILILGFLEGPVRSVVGVASSFFIGWGLCFALFFASRAVGRKLSVEESANQTSLGYCLLSASGYMLCSSAILTAALVVFDCRVYQALGVRQVLAAGIGFWLAATFWSIPSALYRWLLSREISAKPGEVSPLSVQFRSTPGETAFLISAALACAVALAEFRFPQEDIIGRLYPSVVFTVCAVLAVIVVPLLKPSARPGLRYKAVEYFGVLIYLALTALCAYLVSAKGLRDLRAFYAFEVGFATGMLLMLMASYRPPFTRVGSPFGLEIAVAQILVVMGAAVVTFRLMSGYGVALCTVGILSSLPILFPVGALWAVHRTPDDLGEVDLPFMAHAASRFAEIVTAAGSFLLIIALLRLFRERSGLGSAGVDITDPYPLIGLVVGGSFPIVVRALSQLADLDISVATFERDVLTRLGRWAAVRTVALWFLVGIVPLIVSFFGRMESAGAFLVGLAASELLLTLSLWFGEVRNTADEGIRLATRAAHLLSDGAALVTVLLVPPFARIAEEIPRLVKFICLIGILAVAIAGIFISAHRRQSRS
jgi:hypothetical protein